MKKYGSKARKTTAVLVALVMLLTSFGLGSGSVFAEYEGDFQNPEVVQTEYNPDIYYVYYNGNIYTQKNESATDVIGNETPFDTAAAMVTKGQFIEYVGDGATGLTGWVTGEETAESAAIGTAAAPGANAVWIDLGGATVIPGLHDSHLHLEGGGAQLSQPNIFWKPKAEILATIATEVAKRQPGEWITGTGWNQAASNWDAGRTDWPTKEELDEVSPENPVALRRTDGHAMWVNTLALEAAPEYQGGKINAATMVDPVGGVIIRDAAGNATGVLVDTAMNPVSAMIPAAGDAQLTTQLYLAQEHAFKHGITSVMNAGSSVESVDRFMREYRNGGYKLRAYVELSTGADPATAADAVFRSTYAAKYQNEFGPDVVGEFDNRLTVKATKIMLDGALGSRGAKMIEPYSDAEEAGLDADYTGASLRYTETELYDIMKRNIDAGFVPSAHAIGDDANRQFMRTYEKILKDTGKLPANWSWENPSTEAPDLRPRLEHFQIVEFDPNGIKYAAKLGITPSMQFVHATSDMNMAGDRIGEARLKGAYAWRQALNEGMVLANGTDWMVELINPYHGLYAAVTRLDREGNSPRGVDAQGNAIPWNPIDTSETKGGDERLTRAEALHAYTYGGAYAQFEEAIKGTLEVGKLADFVVLDRDYFTCPASEIKDMNAVMTVLGGEVVYTMEEPAITSASLGDGAVGVAYSTTASATGSPTFAWSITAKDEGLAWLAINASSGDLSGTPTAAGTFNFTVRAENYLGSVTKPLSITVLPAQEGQGDGTFTDVSANAWYNADVMWAYENGLMTGTSADKFSPGTSLTRGMIVTILYRMEESPDASSLDNPFNDVAAGAWYADAVKWAAANEIVTGVGGGGFSPAAEITRQDLATIIMRYMTFKEISLPVTQEYILFADEADIAGYAKEAIQTLNKLEIITGVGENSIDPKGEATRAQTAAIFHRFADVAATAEPVPDTATDSTTSNSATDTTTTNTTTQE